MNYEHNKCNVLSLKEKEIPDILITYCNNQEI